MNLTLDGRALELEGGARYLDAVAALYPQSPRRALGVRVEGLTLPLTDPVRAGKEAASLTVYTEEGRRIYERSLRFILLMAIEELYPAAKVRIENSTQMGIYMTVDGARMNADAAEKIEEKMREIVRADLPYEKTTVTREEAIAHFRARGEADKTRLLLYRPFESFCLYKCGNLLEYFYGEMAPSTGYSPVFAVKFHMPGLELKLPDPEHPDRPSAAVMSRMMAKTFAESANWAQILGCANAADLNEMVLTGDIREFIRVDEALHEKSVSGMADAFVKSGARLILIAGPSSSGKTTFAHRLMIQLKVRGLKPVKISLDDYYLDRDQIPLEPDGDRDFERVEALDLPLFNRQIVALLQGETVPLPEFDFKAGRRKDEARPLRLEPGEPVVIEGIHALNGRLTEEVARDQKFQIYISALTTLNLDDHNRIRTTDVRLLRRIVRDHQFRGTDPEGTMSMWNRVREGERRYILPFQDEADAMFNSTLVYELAILKKYAYPMLMKISPQSPYYTRAHRLLKFLNYIQPADVEDEIPPNSILREFIGGCCFYR